VTALHDHEEQQVWEYDEFAGEHDGRAAAVLADGSEPKPMLYDTGSTANFHETSDWWVYDGTRRAPLATGLRGACSCGWRGSTVHPLDWDEVPDDPYGYDLDGPYNDWDDHVAGVASLTVPLPAQVSGLLQQVDSTLEGLADSGPLAALRALAALERTLARTSRTAAYHLDADEVPLDRIATGLGISPRSARSLLTRRLR
jgi:hypothetical protein